MPQALCGHRYCPLDYCYRAAATEPPAPPYIAPFDPRESTPEDVERMVCDIEAQHPALQGKYLSALLSAAWDDGQRDGQGGFDQPIGD